MDRTFRDVGWLGRETVGLLLELALAEMGVAEGGIRMVLGLVVDGMGQEVAVRNLWGHVHKGSVIEGVQSRRDDAAATEAELVLGDVAVI